MNRTIRGLEDHETQERKRLHRDVRSPSQRLADALKLGQVQIGGMFGAGVCLFLFPVLATPLFLAGIALFLARCACINKERLPFRMPMGLSGTDRGDPLPGRGGFARPEGIPCPDGAVLPDRKASSFSATGFRTNRSFG